MALSTGAQGVVYMGYSDDGVSFTNEAMTIVAGRAKAYITDRTKRAWFPDAPITLTYAGGTYTGKAVICAGGIVRFSPALGAGITVTASGKYMPVASCGTCRTLNLDVTVNEEDATTIPLASSTDAGWAINAPTIRTFSGSMDLIMDDTAGHAWRDAALGNPDDGEGGSVAGGKVLFVEFGVPGAWLLSALVWPSISINTSASALAVETVPFTGAGTPPAIL